MVENETLLPYAQFGVGALILVVVALIEPTYNMVTSFSANCKESVIESNTFFEASKGCLYIKGK
jgi:hypothetical protein